MKYPARPGDRAIFEQLLARGDALTTPRHTIVFFYKNADDARGPELVLNPLAQRLVAAGWAITDLRADAVIAEAQRAADAASIDALSSEMEALAAASGVAFDGWECAIVQGGA